MKKKPISEESLMEKLGEFKYQYNMRSVKGSGRTVQNQVVCVFSNGELFQSYETSVAAYVHGQLYVDEGYHDYSVTTMAYCKQFTGMTAGERRKAIKEGKIRLFEYQ